MDRIAEDRTTPPVTSDPQPARGHDVIGVARPVGPPIGADMGAWKEGVGAWCQVAAAGFVLMKSRMSGASWRLWKTPRWVFPV